MDISLKPLYVDNGAERVNIPLIWFPVKWHSWLIMISETRYETYCFALYYVRRPSRRGPWEQACQKLGRNISLILRHSQSMVAMRVRDHKTSESVYG